MPDSDPRRARFFSAIRARISYANVVSTLALFLALGGGVYAANKVGSAQIQNNSVLSKDLKNKKGVKGKDVKDGSLGGADVGDGSLGGADVGDGSLGGADVADGSLTGADLAADEAPHVVGAAGEPTFGDGGEADCLWQDFGAPFNPVSFYFGKDGRIHLAGLAAAQNGGGGCGGEVEDFRVFTLPPGYRPANVELFSSPADTDFFQGPVEPHEVVIGADQDVQFDLGLGASTIPAGAVMVVSPGDNPQGVALDGLDFRAAGTGGFG